MSRLAKRTEQVVPFYAVELFKQASALNAQGRDIISLGIGEPDFTAPTQVVETLHRAAQAEIGRASCRERVCQYVLISVVAVSLKKKSKTKYSQTTTISNEFQYL